MNAAGIRWGGSSCAEVNFGMHVITRTKQSKLLRLTICLCGALSVTKAESALLILGITNSNDAFIIGDKIPAPGIHRWLAGLSPSARRITSYCIETM